jgi:pilus assembly protein Flp/PilA
VIPRSQQILNSGHAMNSDKRFPLSLSPAMFVRLLSDERGTTAIEYALLASGIGLAIVTVAELVGTNIKANFYDKIGSML